ncbi:hypothetical protein Aph01nite_06660 [Acrocarpospora phusangensis]|uniref:Right handed beta helix domain-containing protein n=1 Tax=Acrocarpospora phusangensis TaxID=1070424 RepID=A0A919Q685_9ACTN|nr:right-handed parallel beta-helix repeat-containing protein [Acrocarpospora phusangensis]GIH22356.1 hypothetical protein Aph01nite_06660 [Acrocarpospora phusangensis]
MRRIPLLAFVFVLLAACTPAPPVASPTDTPGPSTPTAEPSPTVTPPCPNHPTPACTGVPPGTKLRKLKLNEDGEAYRVRKRGTVLDGVHIPGVLLIHAEDVVVRNSRIDGYVSNLDGEKSFRFSISDSTVGPAKGCITMPAVGYERYTALRLHVRGNSDGFRASGDDIEIRDSYIYLCSNPDDHSDGVQAYDSGKGLIFDHNTVDQRFAKDITAPIFLTDGRQRDITLTNNLIMGGTFSIQVREAGGKMVVTGNRLVDKSWVYGPVDSECPRIDWQDNTLVTIDEDYTITGTVGPLECVG